MIEHKSISIAEQVFEKLEKDILSGVYERGQILTETKLSEALGVSRTPIREALRRLEQEHIIEIGSKGAVVIGISAEDIDMIYEIRMRIEGLCARLAAERATDEVIGELSEVIELQEFYTTKENADNIKNADNKFHQTLYKACGSLSLSDCLSELHKKVVKYRKASVSSHSRADESLREHRAIFEAIKSHNGSLAEQLALTHIANAQANIRKKKESN